MKMPFQPGDQRRYDTRVTEDKLARFDAGLVHPVYSTFALGRDAEWACRLFVLDMLEPGEEGVGAFLSIRHHAPAPPGAEIRITATLAGAEGRRIRCTWEARHGSRLIASGEQEQHILRKADFDAYLATL
ncbi:MAG: hypothetical protein NW241_18640 [Bacteroidia bacterium]|nr:hypothetical protein [Bacteroidia bacterium]